jgi:hypothetical protein
MTSGFEPARGPDGFVQIQFAIFLALKKDSLSALVI